MKIDLTCPIEMRGYELICDDRGCVRAYITFNNLAPHAIARFDAIVCWANSTTGQISAQPFRADRIDADARANFRFTLSTTAVPDADTLEIHFTRVRYADGEADWIGGQADAVEIDELPAVPGAEMRLLTMAAGEDAVRFPEKHENHWVCVCGRANFRHQTTCSRCLRDRTDVLRNLNRGAIVLGKKPQPRPETRKTRDENDFVADLKEKFRLFTRQRDILVRRTVTMSVIITLLLGAATVSDFHQRVENANRGAIPPKLSVRAE